MKDKKVKIVNNSSACDCNINLLTNIIISHYIKNQKTRKEAKFKELGIKCTIEENEDSIIISFFDYKT